MFFVLRLNRVRSWTDDRLDWRLSQTFAVYSHGNIVFRRQNDDSASLCPTRQLSVDSVPTTTRKFNGGLIREISGSLDQDIRFARFQGEGLWKRSFTHDQITNEDPSPRNIDVDRQLRNAFFEIRNAIFEIGDFSQQFGRR